MVEAKDLFKNQMLRFVLFDIKRLFYKQWTDLQSSGVDMIIEMVNHHPARSV